MKKTTSLFSLFLIALLVYWSFYSLTPSYKPDADLEKTSFSTDRAMSHIKKMAQKQHGVGFPAHDIVKDYIINELENLGLETTTQIGYTAGDWANYSKASNILARIKGSENGKALLLLSHYDSAVHSSYGASDAASGVATVLEGIRAFLANNTIPKNDIIILFTDAEELGLNGADLFVNKHPWAKEVGLAINFEARGSGGPAYMLLETNGGNANLIANYVSANPKYPVANSLVYSIYKMLPNDTDLTVFREDGDIEGFNFAFIDDHYDYHTTMDIPERLDPETLAHQGTNLMPLLHYFSNASLNLKSSLDVVYFNTPIFGLVSYPFSWIWPMFGVACLIFLILLIKGIKNRSLNSKELLTGFAPLLISLSLCGIVGFYSWKALLYIYPQYKDMLHGFTYNGYTYITAFVSLSIGICFLVYHKFKKIATANLLVAPLLIWLIICGLIAVYLQGASFFILAVFGLLMAFILVLNQKEPNTILLVLLSIPALWIFSPFIKMFPVGLGLKMMVAATLLCCLCFFIILPLFASFKNKGLYGRIALLFFIGCLIKAHFNADFNKDNAKPSSLLYVLDVNTGTSKWATYDHELIEWNQQFISENKMTPKKIDNTISSKYGTGFTFTAEAPKKDIAFSTIEKTRDTIIENQRHLEICITPKRNINRLEVYTNTIPIKAASINHIALNKEFLDSRKQGGRLITHYVTNNEYTLLNVTIPINQKLEITVYEASNDLLNNPLFSVPNRPDSSIPTPFILNDAILLTKSISY